MEGFKDLDLIAHSGQVTCACQAGRAGTDDCDLLVLLLCSRLRLYAVLSCPVGNESFQFADGFRLTLNAEDADAFTLGLLRTYTAADCRKG